MNIWSLKKLEEFLLSNNVDISNWGKSDAKTLNHLLNELIKNECEIYVKDGKVTRKVSNLSINVYYKNKVLKEDHQKFKDGRTRKRKMDWSVGEKLTKDELTNVRQSIHRAMSEELQINDIKDSQVTDKGNFETTSKSFSYPGVMMEMVIYKYDIILSDSQYNPDGYVEKQEDKETFFIWIDK